MRWLTACVLAASTLASLGCCGTDDAIKHAAEASIRDLRSLRSELVPLLPEQSIEVGDKTWTLRGLWDNRLGAMVVRERSLLAGLTTDRSFDTETVAREEGVTQEPR